MNNAFGLLLVMASGATMLLASAGGAESSEMSNKSIDMQVVVQAEESGRSILKCENRSDGPVAWKSNAQAVFASLFLGFPTVGSLQIRDGKGDPVRIEGEGEDGWWAPSVFSSSVDIEAEKKVRNGLESEVIPPKQSKEFSFDCDKVLTLAKTAIPGGSPVPPLSFRVRVPVRWKGASEIVHEEVVVSDWTSWNP